MAIDTRVLAREIMVLVRANYLPQLADTLSDEEAEVFAKALFEAAARGVQRGTAEMVAEINEAWDNSTPQERLDMANGAFGQLVNATIWTDIDYPEGET